VQVYSLLGPQVESLVMACPPFNEFFIPVLRVLADGQARSIREVRNAVPELMSLSDDDLAETIPSGQPAFENRANWAMSYLTRAGALTRPNRGVYQITDVGRDVMKTYSGGLTASEVENLPYWFAIQYSNARTSSQFEDGEISAGTVAEENSTLDPVEQIESGITRIHDDVAADLLLRFHQQEPEFFERAVLRLLLAMGYGGAEGRAIPTQLVRDGGIDGIIDQDALGLARIYVQAKRYDPLQGSVGRPAIQAFVGALVGNNANQGVFITTAQFSKDARDYAESVGVRVVLIDGERLARLMIRYRVGVQVKDSVDIVEVDEDFFE